MMALHARHWLAGVGFRVRGLAKKSLTEQRWLDGLLFMRSRRHELVQKEMELAA